MKFSSQLQNGRQNKAFTLIELLVSIAIIALLTSIVFASLSSARARSRDGKRISDIKQIQLGLENYFDVCKQYPADFAVLTSGGTCVGGSGTFSAILPSMPKDPKNNNLYAYNCPSPYNAFSLQAQLEQYNNVLESDANTTNTGQLLYDISGQ